MQTLLLVDDDTNLLQMLQAFLSEEGFRVLIATNGRQALELVEAFEPALLVLDYMMPELDGIQVLALLRQHNAVPVLMLTARHDDADRIKGLDMGADDYLAKPFNARELLARIRAILRRTQTRQALTQHLIWGDLQLFSDKACAYWQQQPLELTHTEYRLLEILVRQVGYVVSKEEMALYALKRPLTAFDRSIDVHIGRLRAKLSETAGEAVGIRTVRAQGYQLLTEST
jgi:DNA-binding response OmpR family regulator